MQNRSSYIFRLSLDAARRLTRELDARAKSPARTARCEERRVPEIRQFYDTVDGTLITAGWLAHAAPGAAVDTYRYGLQQLRATRLACQRSRAWPGELGAAKFDPACFAALPGLSDKGRRLLASSPSLEPVLRADLQRSSWLLVGFAAQDLAVTLERGHYELAGQRVELCELTLSGQRDAQREPSTALLALAHSLNQIAPLSLRPESALRGALREHFNGVMEPRKYQAPKAARSDHPAALCHAHLSRIAEHWLANQEGTREQAEIEFVHQLRVALRRWHTAGKLFTPWLDPAWQARLAPELRWLRHLLGQTRDWDVLVSATLPTLDAATPRLAEAPDRRVRQALIQAEMPRSAARAAVQAALRSARYATLMLDLLQGLAAGAVAAPAGDSRRKLRKRARAWLRKHDLNRAALENFSALPQAQQHRTRLHAKRLRYSLEFLAPILARHSRRAAERSYAVLLDALGGANDAVVATGLQRQLTLDPAAHADLRGRLAARRQSHLAQAELQLPRLRTPALKSRKAGGK